MEAATTATTAIPAALVPEPPRALATGASQGREALRAVPLKSLPRPSVLDTSLAELRGAGPKLVEAAAELELATLGDLLWHAPRDYRDRRAPTQIVGLKIGEEATIEVEVRSATVRPTRNRRLRILEAVVADETGSVGAIWFNQAWLAEKLVPGTRLLLQGKLEKRGFRVGAYELVSSEEEPGETPTGIHTTGIVPVHPASEKLSAQRLREWAWQASRLAPNAIEPLPAPLRVRRGLAGAADCFRTVHFPKSEIDAEAARYRLAFEELFLYQAALAMRRRKREQTLPGIRLGAPGEAVRSWLGSLPFELTGDQRRACEEIDADLAPGRPDAAAADGRGRQRQDRGRAVRDAARGRGRPPGGADGADRDARRAALRDPRAAARPAGAAGSRC